MSGRHGLKTPHLICQSARYQGANVQAGRLNARIVAPQRICIAAPIGRRRIQIARRFSLGANVLEIDVGIKTCCILEALRSTDRGNNVPFRTVTGCNNGSLIDGLIKSNAKFACQNAHRLW
jgi:hypothetical protein